MACAGPNLFSEQSQIVYTFMFGLLIATILMLPIGLMLGRYAFRTVIAVPGHVLAPMIAMTILDLRHPKQRRRCGHHADARS